MHRTARAQSTGRGITGERLDNLARGDGEGPVARVGVACPVSQRQADGVPPGGERLGGLEADKGWRHRRLPRHVAPVQGQARRAGVNPCAPGIGSRGVNQRQVAFDRRVTGGAESGSPRRDAVHRQGPAGLDQGRGDAANNHLAQHRGPSHGGHFSAP